MPPELHTTMKQVDTLIGNTERTIVPLRRSIFRRFPAFFTLVVTFGVTATFFGIERILSTTPFFYEHPWYTLSIGIIVLVATGKLYAKLG